MVRGVGAGRGAVTACGPAVGAGTLGADVRGGFAAGGRDVGVVIGDGLVVGTAVAGGADAGGDVAGGVATGGVVCCAAALMTDEARAAMTKAAVRMCLLTSYRPPARESIGASAIGSGGAMGSMVIGEIDSADGWIGSNTGPGTTGTSGDDE